MPDSLTLREVRDELAYLREDTNALREAVANRVSYGDLDDRITDTREWLEEEVATRQQNLKDYYENLRLRRRRVRRRWVIIVAVLVALTVWGSQVRRARDAARVADAIERERAVAVQACEDRRELALIVAGIFNTSTTADDDRRAELEAAAEALLAITDAPC